MDHENKVLEKILWNKKQSVALFARFERPVEKCLPTIAQGTGVGKRVPLIFLL